MSDKKIPGILPQLKRLFLDYRQWTFPAVLTLLLVLLSALSISGSSVGIYDSLLGQPAKNLIVGTPRADRSDEWLVNTPLTLSQKANDYRVINPAIGQGSDTSIVIDVPYKEWSTLFKPQSLSFFVLPFTVAFAFKWWVLLYVLMMSVYIFILTVFPRRYLLASILAVFFGFSPYIQWWYQSITVLPVAYMLLMVSIVVRLVEAERLRSKILGSLAIGYLGACFALLLYPPYQLISALVGIVLFAAIYLSRHKVSRAGLKNSLWVILPLLFSGIIFGAFLLAHKAAVTSELNSVYPGHRTVASGGMSLLTFFNWPLSYLLLRGGPLSVFGSAQSESANFLLFGVCIIPYLAFSLFISERRRRGRADERKLHILKYLFIGMCVLMAVLLARMFLPVGSSAYKLIGLGPIPHSRLFLGIGVINLVFLALALELPAKPFKGLKSLWSWAAVAMGTAWFVTFILLLKAIKHTYRLAGVGNLELVALALFCSLMIALLCHQLKLLRYAGLLGILCFALFVSLPVNPLYKGLGSLADSPLSRRIAHIHRSDPSAAWAVVNQVPLEAIPTAFGVKNFSGVYPYPQNDVWSKYFSREKPIYDRYAHVTFNVDDSLRQRSLNLVQQDEFSVNLNSCDPLLTDMNIKYLVVSGSAVADYKCYKPYTSVPAQDTKITIYKRG